MSRECSCPRCSHTSSTSRSLVPPQSAYGAFRVLTIFVDGRLVGRLRAGNDLRVDVGLGSHVIETYMLGFRAKLEVNAAGTPLLVEILGAAGPWWRRLM